MIIWVLGPSSKEVCQEQHELITNKGSLSCLSPESIVWPSLCHMTDIKVAEPLPLKREVFSASIYEAWAQAKDQNFWETP